MRKLSLLVLMVLIFISTGASHLPNAIATAKPDRSEELLAKARAALGGDKLKAIQALAASGKLRRVMGGQDISGSVKLEFLLPDKYKRTETSTPMADIEISLSLALNGDQAWADTKTNSANARVMVATPGSRGNSPTIQASQLRPEFLLNFLLFTLGTPANSGVQFSFAGEADVQGTRAFVIDSKGPDGFNARILLDQKTYRPMMISYQGNLPRTAVRTLRGSPAQIEKERQNAEATPEAQKTEIQIMLSNYRDNGGIMMPHSITRAANGAVFEEWDMSKYNVNPKGLEPKDFVKQ
jgi:hypothetical protein